MAVWRMCNEIYALLTDHLWSSSYFIRP